MPEGHQGLHGFLYGEDGAEAHEGGSSYTFREVRPLGLLRTWTLTRCGIPCTAGLMQLIGRLSYAG